MTASAPLHLFEGFGVEIEYMIVAEGTLDVLPAADVILHYAAGEYANEVAMGPISWSNELALHVIELKTTGPSETLEMLPDLFQKDIRRINNVLAGLYGKLMPGGMHPWMDPLTQTRLWPHGYNAIYEAYNRIFDCRGHGWSNLQSVHLNIPFANDKEFAALHTAVRLVLPVLPALAASSPVMDGTVTGIRDNRLEVYRFNQKKIPQAAGDVIPDPAFSRSEYDRKILQPLYAAIAPHDPEAILQEEWLNSRGAIARFERNTIEIRLLDTQECPRADMAVLSLITAVIRALIGESLSPAGLQKRFSTQTLASILKACIVDGEDAMITDADYLRIFDFPANGPVRTKDLLFHLADRLVPANNPLSPPLRHILKTGTLATRILRALEGDFRREKLKEVYGGLCQCLDRGELFG